MLLKLVGYLVILALFVLSMFVIFQRQELNLQKEAQALVRVNPLPKAQGVLFKAGEICNALEHLEYFMDFDYVLKNKEIQNFSRENQS